MMLIPTTQTLGLFRMNSWIFNQNHGAHVLVVDVIALRNGEIINNRILLYIFSWA